MAQVLSLSILSHYRFPYSVFSELFVHSDIITLFTLYITLELWIYLSVFSTKLAFSSVLRVMFDLRVHI